MKVRIGEWAKSTYAGRVGTLAATKPRRTRLGAKYAKHFCVVFESGFRAGTPLWFSSAEMSL